MWIAQFYLMSMGILFVSCVPAPQVQTQLFQDDDDNNLERTKRQSVADSGGTPEGVCDFGTNDDINLCDWVNGNFTQLMWKASKGQNSNWVGGPRDDVSYGDSLGGYAYIETSQLNGRVQGQGFESAMLISSTQKTTKPTGICILFEYIIAGLSPDQLRVLLHPLSEEEMNEESSAGYDGSDDMVIWNEMDQTQDAWAEGNVVYTYDKPHQIIFEGIPVSNNDPSRQYQGYIALDEIRFVASSNCGAFCTFEGDICSWSQDVTDDFDWTLSRGSLNPSTGAYRDRSSFRNPAMTGGFLQIDSGYPRRPGDVARLESLKLEATKPDIPLCMKFWTHMFGNGIGTLRVMIKNIRTEEDNIIWKLDGEAGNEWYQGQVPIASPTSFQIVFEAEVGNNNLGDIAIDEISIKQGACPSAPQLAAGNRGDCTFELDECGWQNPRPIDRLDEADWVRVLAADSRAPSKDHTQGTQKGYYMALPRGNVQRAGDRAWLVSATVKGSDNSQCIAFWYFMFEQFIDQSGPSLGSMMVHVMIFNSDGGVESVKPIWSLKNHQGPNWMYGQANVKSEMDFSIVFEGMWGSTRGNGFMAIDDITFYMGDCTTKPKKATTTNGNCDFQRDACQWKNETTEPRFKWSVSSITNTPASLPDHTFGGPVGYVYFDVFNQKGDSQVLKLMSSPLPATPEKQDVCLTFWYSAFGSSATLTVQRQDAPASEDDELGDAISLWERTAETSGSVDYRADWMFGQVSVSAGSDYIVTFKGMANNGGYALDDITIYPGTCSMRPTDSEPNAETEETTRPALKE